MKRVLPLSIIIIAAIFGAWRYATPPCVNSPKAVFSEGWDGSYEVKVEADSALCSFFPGNNQAYVFSSRISGTEKWNEIARLHYDDYDETRIASAIHSVNRSLAFAYLKDSLLVTTDATKTWTLWTVSQNFAGWKAARGENVTWKSIKEANINEDGSGEMIISGFSSDASEATMTLHSTDFGRNWTY